MTVWWNPGEAQDWLTTLDETPLARGQMFKEWTPQSMGRFRAEAVVRGPGGAGSCSMSYEIRERAPTCVLEASPTSTLVGDPLQKGLSPTDIIADSIIMPPVFSLNNVNAAGVSQQVRDALSHGLVIRILISWRPSEIADANSTARAWSETLIVRRE